MLPAPPERAAAPAAAATGTQGAGGPMRGRRRGRRTMMVGAGVFALIAGAAILGLMLAQATPGWWMEIDPKDPAVIEAAQRVENGAATQLTKIRKSEPSPGSVGASEPWTIKLTASDANAWLAARLRPWLEAQEGEKFTWPRDLERVEIEFQNGRIYVGASIRKPGEEGREDAKRQILSAALRPELRSDGGLWMPATWVSVGRLSLPPSWMLPRSKREGNYAKQKRLPDPTGMLAEVPQLSDLLGALAGERAAMQTAIIKIGDGRRVRLLGLEPKDGALYITCQTLAREEARAGR